MVEESFPIDGAYFFVAAVLVALLNENLEALTGGLFFLETGGDLFTLPGDAGFSFLSWDEASLGEPLMLV